MIKKDDLLEAIAECQGERNPNANTCIKLAAYYTIYDNLYGKKPEESGSSYSAPPSKTAEVIGNYGESEFLSAIQGQKPAEIWEIIDELMSVLKATNTRLYDAVMRKIYLL